MKVNEIKTTPIILILDSYTSSAIYHAANSI
jgi:hypothetical protein